MTLMYAFDIIGTLAFALMGALVGIERKLDLFGIVTLALATAIGGGILRDLCLGNVPPASFRTPLYVGISIGGVFLAVFISWGHAKFHKTILISDAIGLGSFAAAGANLAVTFGHGNLITIVFLAVVTAAGGGAIRDVLIATLPSVLYKEIYATAALCGAVCFYFVYPFTGTNTAMYLCFIITTGLRLYAVYRHWNLPDVTQPPWKKLKK